MQKIPQAQSERVLAIRQVFWDALDDALDTLDDDIAARARQAMRKIRKSNYSKRVIKRETKLMVAYTNDAATRAVAEQIRAAAEYAQRSADVVRAWQISGRLKEGVEHLTVSDSAMARALRPGASAIDAEAALAKIKIAPIRTRSQAEKSIDTYGATSAGKHVSTTEGTKQITKLTNDGLMARPKQVGLSTRLHGSAAQNVATTEEAIGTALREASNMNKAGRDLVSAIRRGGDELSVNRRLTKPLERLQRAGRKLQILSVNQGDAEAMSAARKEWNSAFKQIKRVAAQRVDERGGYKELIQIIEKQGFKGIDKATTRWLDEKQAFHAERLVETETNAAYRSREYEQHQSKPYIVGFWWRRSPGMLQIDTKRKKDITRVRKSRRRGRKAKRKTKGQPCRVCPQLADRRYPVSVAREYPRGAHPMCRCWYEWIYDTTIRDKMPVTQADLDWYDNLPD
jgi:hypothetical protein